MEGTDVESEAGTWYYHADHLGSSSVVTGRDGEFYEQIEYFPYGETWVHNKSSEEMTGVPYKFTGKEQDVETGLYYHGARSRDPRVGGWYSVDPILSQYLDGKPAGGVYNPVNLNLYHYAGNNPIIMSDPTGTHNTPDGGLVATKLYMGVSTNEGGGIAAGSPMSGTGTDTQYQILQATNDTQGKDFNIYDATTGQRTGDYTAGNYYINVDGKIYDVSNVALPTQNNKTLYQHLSRLGDPTTNWFTNGTTQGRTTPWLDDEDVSNLARSTNGAGLAASIMRSDEAFENKGSATRNTEANNWHVNVGDLIDRQKLIRGVDRYDRTHIIRNGNYDSINQPFLDNVKRSVYSNGASIRRLNGYSHKRHITD